MTFPPSLIAESLRAQARDPFATPYVTPDPPIVRDIREVSALLPHDAASPETDWSDDGSATLRWYAKEGRSSFALVFDGSGMVVGVTGSFRRVMAPWKLAVRDREALSRRFDDPLVASVIAGRFHLEAV